MTKLVRTLNEVPAKFVRTLAAVRDTKRLPLNQEPNFSEIESKWNAHKFWKQISKMTVLELSQLIKDMEEKFGVSAAAAVAVAGPAAGAGAARRKPRRRPSSP